jgi:hypothetical protein
MAWEMNDDTQQVVYDGCFNSKRAGILSVGSTGGSIGGDGDMRSGSIDKRPTETRFAMASPGGIRIGRQWSVQ